MVLKYLLTVDVELLYEINFGIWVDKMNLNAKSVLLLLKKFTSKKYSRQAKSLVVNLNDNSIYHLNLKEDPATLFQFPMKKF